jgi:TetR/AcrR family transcriptional regulator, transcriptional repressor for nem operon
VAVRARKGTVSSPGASTGERAAVSTRTRILDVAERLVQVRGFNGFSYADIAAELAITKASLHHHFPSKAGLGEALIVRYTERFADALAAIDARASAAPAKLDAYTGLYVDVLREERMCLCGMLAAEYQTLPAAVQDAVIAFLDENEDWLERVLEQGLKDGSLRFSATTRETARGILGGLEGAMLVARSRGELESFQTGATLLLTGLAGT